MSKVNIEVLDGRKPETEPDAKDIGKTQMDPPSNDGDEAGGRAQIMRMLCWNCAWISFIEVSDHSYNYYTCCNCGATNGPF